MFCTYTTSYAYPTTNAYSKTSHRDLILLSSPFSPLGISPTRDHDRLATNVAHQRTGYCQDHARRLRRRARPPQRDILVPLRRLLLRIFVLLGLPAPRDAQRDFGPVTRCDERTLFLGRRQPRRDRSVRNRVGADSELRAPLLADGLGEPEHAGLGEGVVRLPRVPARAARAADVDDASGFAVLDAEVGCRGADELEGRGGVEGEDGVPLLVRHLVDHAIPGKAGVVHDDVDFAGSKLGGLLHEVVDVTGAEHVAWDGNGGAT